MEIVKSKFQFRGGRVRTTTFLRSLGVSFRSVEGQDFWQANKEQLAEIFAELRDAVKDKLRELRPDLSGNEVTAIDFIKSWNRIRDSFNWHLPSLPTNTEEAIFFVPRRKYHAPGGFQRPTRVLAAMRRMLDGETNRTIGREMKMNHDYVKKIRRHFNRQISCPCGRDIGHKGMCSERRDMPRYAKSKEWLQQVGAKNFGVNGAANWKGKKQTKEHRDKRIASMKATLAKKRLQRCNFSS